MSLDRLLDAHTEFVLRRLDGAAFATLVEVEIDHALAAAAGLTLGDVVDRAEVTAVAIKYVAAFELPGAIPETVGEIAVRLREQGAAPDVTLGDVLGREPVAALLGKVAELRAVREQIAAAVAASPSVQQSIAEFLRSIALEAINTNRRLVEKVPGVASALSFGQRLAGAPLQQADQLSREMSERAAGTLLGRMRDTVRDSLTDEDVADALREVWAEAAERPMAELAGALHPDDLVDAIAVVYDVWLQLRTSPYLHSLIAAGVDHVFDTYGSYPLPELLAEFGLGRADLVEEALRFAPPVLGALRANGMLRDLVHRHLAAFYESDEARAASSAG